MLKVKKLNDNAILPTKVHKTDLGYDLYASEDCILGLKSIKAVSTSISIDFPTNIGGVIKDRSSYAMLGITTHAGVIDNGYTGEIKVLLSFYPSFKLYDFFHQCLMESKNEYFIKKYPNVLLSKDEYFNSGIVGYKIIKGDKIAQIILTEIINYDVVEVDEITEKDRGDNGFGSTGK